MHRIIRGLVRRATEHVPIEMVLYDREFDSVRVIQTLSNHDVNYLIPKRITSSEREVIETMEEERQEVAVESASVHVEAGSHPLRFLYVPSTSAGERPCSRQISESGRMKLRRFVDAAAAAGRLITSINRSKAISWRRLPQKTIEYGCSTSYSQCYCTISGGLLIFC